MRWRKRKDPIPEAAKAAREEADLAGIQADVVNEEACMSLERAMKVSQALAEVRRKNHFAQALKYSMGGNT
jgi:hypothetical protein